MVTEVEVMAGPLVAGGDALARREGHKVLFAEGALPGERVRVEVTEERKDLARGRVVEVLSASKERIEAPCPVFRRGCGGCQWQHIDPAAQRRHKADIVRDSLRRIAKLPEAPVRQGGAVPDFDYRTTMHLTVVDGGAALHRRHSNDVVPLDLCLIAHPLLEDLIVEGHFGDATGVTLRVSATTGERVAWVRGDASNVRVPDDVTVTPNGRNASVHEDVAGRRFRISARSFFQSGPAAAELLAGTVLDALPRDAAWIVDAYAGVGVLGATAGEELDARITAVEQSHSAVVDARHNLADLDAEVIEAEVATVRLPGEDRPDAVIADPARTGLGRSAARALADLGAPVLVLVSCDPASLARDVNLLGDAGYRVGEVVVLDLFPQTHHVETVTRFERDTGRP